MISDIPNASVGFMGEFDNVNQAFYEICKGIRDGEIPTIRTSSRNGDVLQVEGVSVITYRRPEQRVLFNHERDANPFFHMFEALWMLAGRNDVEAVAFFNKGMRNYSDDGETLNGAYGYRWRKAAIEEMADEGRGQRVDQLNKLIDHLVEVPNSRRAVLQMWNVEDDLLKINSSKDVCCNLSVCFALRECLETGRVVLDMTVFNRSNDLVWGSLGANVVHFSFLQEYVANCLGVHIGRYSQVSNNLHCYVNNWDPDKWIEWEEKAVKAQVFSSYYYPINCSPPLVQDKAMFDSEVRSFCAACRDESFLPHGGFNWVEPWLQQVARPMMLAFRYHKRRQYDTARNMLLDVTSYDWQKAGFDWIERRERCYEVRQMANRIKSKQEE